MFRVILPTGIGNKALSCLSNIENEQVLVVVGSFNFCAVKINITQQYKILIAYGHKKGKKQQNDYGNVVACK